MVTVYHIRGAKSKPFLSQSPIVGFGIPRSASFPILRYRVAEKLCGPKHRTGSTRPNVLDPYELVMISN